MVDQRTKRLVTQEHMDSLALGIELSKARNRIAKLETALREVSQYAAGHHADQESCFWLHSLTVDIPHMIEKDLEL